MSRGRRLWRLTLLVHRYLGIGLGVLVFLWCTSGVIMMYVQYPALDRVEALSGLEPLRLGGCCDIDLTAPDAALAVAGYHVEMLNGRAVMHITLTNGSHRAFDLADNRWLVGFDEQRVHMAGQAYAMRRGWTGTEFEERLQRDQWTVYRGFDAHRPLYKFSDDVSREWYVSSQSGEVVQLTTARERFWNWLGSVVHWLYPTVLRQHTAVWSQTVIWLTIVALFLTVTGLLIGIKQTKTGPSGRVSPHGGWLLWHHWIGLIFGVLTLTWLVSGLLSMNPWGAFEGRSFQAEAERLRGDPTTLAGSIRELERVSAWVPPPTVRLASANWLGQPGFVASDADGGRMRLSAAGIAPALDGGDMQAALVQLRPGAREADLTLLAEGDGYYYRHHEPKEFPVFRFTYADGERLYVSPVSGRLLHAIDSNQKWYRWLFEALHRGDFHALARLRPVWDIMMLTLLLGVTAGALTGVVLGYRRVT
ncbi:MAG: PepSY domain-containing protein [Gammaproteobacteria bacterium]|nr:PepSY domain-containing protein [Gammaproteobacteria bacterium]